MTGSRVVPVWCIAVLVLVGAGCSSGSAGTAPDVAAGGATGGSGAGGEGGGAGGSQQAAADAAEDSASDRRTFEVLTTDAGTTLACPESVAALCAPGDPPPGTSTGPFCRSTLAAAENDAVFCRGRGATVVVCGAYTVVRDVGADSGLYYYYDASGALVAVTQVGNSGERCLGGPATFGPAVWTTPSACGAVMFLSACGRDGSAG